MDEIKDRRDIIREAMEAQESENNAEANTEQLQVENNAPEAVADIAKEVKIEKNRDGKGKFAKTEPVATENNKIVEGEEPKVEKILAPKAYKKELVDKFWDKLDPELQKAIAQREEDSAKGFEAFKQHANLGKSVETAIMPYMATINQFGATPDQAIKELFGVDHVLRYGQPHEKIGMMQRIFRDYGIDPKSVIESYTQQQPQIDPALAPVYNELQGLKAQQQQWLKQQQDREAEMLLNEVMTFSQGKEHINEVQNEMMALLPQIVNANPNMSYQEKLQKAYDMAIWARPDLRESLLQQEREKASQSANAAELARKQQAASVSVKGSSPALGTSATPKTRREIIEAQFR